MAKSSPIVSWNILTAFQTTHLQLLQTKHVSPTHTKSPPLAHLTAPNPDHSDSLAPANNFLGCSKVPPDARRPKPPTKRPLYGLPFLWIAFSIQLTKRRERAGSRQHDLLFSGQLDTYMFVYTFIYTCCIIYWSIVTQVLIHV